MQRTLSIIKPDAVMRNITGKVNTMIEDAGLRIIAQKLIHLTTAQAEEFYEEHKEKAFFGGLVEYMFWRETMPLRIIAKLWAQLIRLWQKREPSAKRLPCQLHKIPCMALIVKTVPKGRFLSSLTKLKLSARSFLVVLL